MSSIVPNSLSRKVRVLVVGQTPPPVHGQSVCLQRVVESNMDSVEIVHVRMAFSKSNDEVGRFQIRKLSELVSVILRIWWVRLTNRIDVFYYPPAGPNRIPIYRDIIILLCTRWMFPKTVYHMHASGGSEVGMQMRGLSRFLFKRAYNKPDAVIRLSEHTIDDATNYEAKRQFFVPNCAEDEFDRFANSKTTVADDANTKTSSEPDPLQLLYLGTVCKTKGVLDLLMTCSQLRRREIEFHLHVVGGFQPTVFGVEVRQLIQDHQLDDHVTLHGQLVGEEKFRRLASADIFCFPTYYESEGFPCVVLEAMSFRLPVVATRWRGIQSIIQQDETGHLVDIRDVPALVGVLERLANDSTLREAWGQAGREQFLARYTVDKHLERMEQVFLAVARNTDPSELHKPVVVAS